MLEVEAPNGDRHLARYFLRISPGDLDDEADACELPSAAEAKAEALKLAGDILKHGGVFTWAEDLTISVTDDVGLLIAQVHVFGIEAPIYKSAPGTLP
jgi:hypothetical protein